MVVSEGKHDGVIIKNVDDVGPANAKLNGESRIADDIIGFSGRTKLADAVTYNDNGIRIPLGDRHNFTINDIRWFGQPSSRTTASTPSSVNPLETRLARLRSIPHYPHQILSEDVTPENIRTTLRQFAPDLTEDQLDMAVQELMASRRGAYLNIGDDVGNTVSGVGVVDRESAIQYLKNRGIQNPTEADIQNVIAHEHGHSVRVSDEALAEISDFPEPDEFFTRAGQIFDEYGIRDTNIAESPITFNEFMNMLQGYLNRGRLDNGITQLREYLNNLSPVRRSRVMKYINRFAATLPVLLAARKITNNGKSK